MRTGLLLVVCMVAGCQRSQPSTATVGDLLNAQAPPQLRLASSYMAKGQHADAREAAEKATALFAHVPENKLPRAQAHLILATARLRLLERERDAKGISVGILGWGA